MVKKRKVKSILGEAAMLGVCVIFFIPFYYLLVNTFKPAREATVSPPLSSHSEFYPGFIQGGASHDQFLEQLW